MTPLVSGTVLGPIRNLMAGTRSVTSGDLGVIVPVTTADEFGELSASFNRMVDGLREREGLREELRDSRARIVAASDDARRQVERDLHDGAQQSLVLLNLKLGLAAKQFDADPHAALAMIEESREELERALAELRDLAHGIYPQVLTSDGLAAALRKAAGDGVTVSGEIQRHAPEIEAAVYFCCLEAMQNASKYGGDGLTVHVSLSDDAGELRFEVSDEGAGFDPSSVNGSAGLQNMADRIGALGGELTIESAPGQGTRVVGGVPISNL
jgi:signal transduction histidine kinase